MSKTMTHVMVSARNQRRGAAEVPAKRLGFLDEAEPKAVRLYLRTLRLAAGIGNAAVMMIVVFQAIADRLVHPLSTLRRLRRLRATESTTAPIHYGPNGTA